MNNPVDLRRAAVAVLATAALAAGCGDRNSDMADQTAAQEQLNPVMTTMDDDRIVASVRSDYFASDQVKAQNIDVSSDQGVVTLKGGVPSDEVRQQAVSLAKQVDGVRNVNDQLQVRAAAGTPSAGDADRHDAGTAGDRADAGWVTTKILAQYYVNPQLKPWNIDVSTSEDGVVTLEGKVDNDKDRSEAIRIAKATDGVSDVRDRLRADDVAATSGTAATGTAAAASGAAASDVGGDLSDAWITTKIRSRFFLDPDIKGRDLDVDTNGGVVVLKGTVGSYSARRQAVSAARNVDGVREVQDQLRVVADDRSAAAVNGRNPVDDGWITTKIQSKYFVDGDLQSSGIDVTTRNRVVTLTGTVTSNEARDAAVKLARDTDGVRSVRDRLRVDAGGPATSR